MKWRLLAVACVLLALGLLLYPLMGELVSEKYHSDVEAVYTAAIAGTDDTELAEQRRAAEAYNALLRGEAAVSTGGASAPPMLYAGQLTVGGAMCTIDIPKIGVYLPVRHGAGAETLERAVGHVVSALSLLYLLLMFRRCQQQLIRQRFSRVIRLRLHCRSTRPLRT